MINGREASSYEKGLLTGIGMGAVLGPSITLVIFLLIICYDLGRPQIIEVGQRALSKVLNLDEAPTNIPTANPGTSTNPVIPETHHVVNFQGSPSSTPGQSFLSPQTQANTPNYQSLTNAATKMGFSLINGAIQNGTT